jgi:hypothetical protein
VVLALLYRKDGPQKEVYHWEEDEEEASDKKDNEGDHPEDPDSENSENKTKEKPYWDVPTPSNDELTVRYRFRH